MADFNVQPLDYGSIMGQGQRLVANPVEQQSQIAQLQNQRVASQIGQAQLAALVQKQQRAQAFQKAFTASDGSPQAVSRLIMQFPEFADQLKTGYDIQDNASKQADLTATSEIYSAASSGNWALAKKLAHDRADAEKARGYNDPTYDQALAVMDGAADGDPAKQKTVLTMLGTHLAAVTGPEHFASVYGSLNGADKGFTLEAGATRYDGNGNVVAQSPYLKGPDGSIAERDAAPGGSAPSVAASGGGRDAAIEHVLNNEGHPGNSYNPSDMNGAPVNYGINAKANAATLKQMGVSDVKDLTRDQAAQIYATKYWPQSGADKLPANLQAPYFDVYIRNPAFAKKALAQSGGDPAKFMALSDAYFTKLAQTPKGAKYAHAWATRDAGNTAIATGATASAANTGAPAAPPGYHWLVPPKGGDQFHVLTPAEVTQRGLDPNQQYQLNTGTGQIAGLGKKEADSDDVLTKYHISPDETGPSVLRKLPANLASQVKALAEGRLPMPSSFALAKPYWQTMLQLTAQYDPTFDAASAPARKAAITAFTGHGKAAQIVSSVNRVANHLELLYNAHQKLAGPDVGWGPANSVLAAAGQSFEPGEAKAYDTEVGFVAGELEKIARNSPGTESGVERIIKNLGRKNSYDTREQAIKAAVGIISGAIDPLKDQYNSAFTNGSTRPNIPWVTPQAQRIFRDIGGADMSLTGAGADSNNAASGPTRISSVAEYNALPSGAHYIDPNGVSRVKR